MLAMRCSAAAPEGVVGVLPGGGGRGWGGSYRRDTNREGCHCVLISWTEREVRCQTDGRWGGSRRQHVLGLSVPRLDIQ